MKHNIKTVAVVGAGAMGSGIAAQAANAGYKVILLDKRPDGAAQAIERMKKAKPTDAFNAGFMHPSNAKNIEIGNTDDHMDKIAGADIVIEAVFENLEVKHNVFRDIYKHAKKDAIITSNTSTIELEDLVKGFPEDFKARFINTHFFNPVRFMHLLEVIDGRDTDPDVLKAASDFGDRVLGKKVIRAKDSPGFIANRIGIYAIERAKSEALEQGTPIEDIDAIFGPSFGFPHLGLFKLADEVGVDIVYHVGQNLQAALPADDHFNEIYKDADKVKAMIDDGYTGKHKGKGGFYRLKTGADGKPARDARGKPLKEVRDLATNEFRDFRESEYFKKTVWEEHGSEAAFFDSDDRAAKFAWPVLRDTLLYVLEHAEGIAYDIQSIDDAMRAGYNWQNGPFQLLDKFGVDWFKQKLAAEGIKAPTLLEKANGSFYKIENNQLKVMDFNGAYNPIKREDGVINLEDIKRKSKPLVSTKSASLWDIGDGVACLEFHSPMNSLEPSVLKAINDSLKFIETNRDHYKAMVIYNDAPDFSVGANLHLVDAFMKAADDKLVKKFGLSNYVNRQAKKFVGEMIYQGQAIFKAMREAPFPVIAAPKGTPQNKSWGGGCEVLLWSDAIQSGPESVIGLVEAGVGLIPGWGGTTRYLERAINKPGRIKGPMAPIIEAAMALANPIKSVSTSAQDAKKKLWLRPDDGITMNPDRVLADAKKRALDMAAGYQPPKPSVFNLPGKPGKGALRMNLDALYLNGGMTHVDMKVIEGMADVLTGGEKLTPDEVEKHAAAFHDQLKKLMREKPDGTLNINATIPLTERRMLALEWKRIMTLANDPDTQARIAHMVKTNKPLREKSPDPAPTPKEIRDSIRITTKNHKIPDGKPLSGFDAFRLAQMANITETALDRKADKKEQAKQNARVLAKLALLF